MLRYFNISPESIDYLDHESRNSKSYLSKLPLPINQLCLEYLEMSSVDIEIEKTVGWEDFSQPIEAFLNNNGDWSLGPVMGETTNDEEVGAAGNPSAGLEGGTMSKRPLPQGARTRVGENEELLDYDKFEKTYFYQVGENDEERWIFFVRHQNGYYIFFEAGCDYTGFDCQGGGSITYSKNFYSIWKMGLDEFTRKEILERTGFYEYFEI